MSITIRDFCPQYLEFCRPHQAPTYHRETCRYARIVVECLGDVPIAELDPTHVLALNEQLGEIEAKPVAANRCKSFVSQLCLHAERLRLRPPQSNPTLCVPSYTERQRDESVPPHLRRKYVTVVQACVAARQVEVSAGALLLLMMYVGLRWSDARLLRWDEVIVRGGKCHLKLHARGPKRSRSKGGERKIPLAPPAVDLLMSLPRWSEWVAPNPKTRRPYTEIRKQRARVYDAAGIKNDGYHRLRHTVGAAAAEAGLSLIEISKILGHRSPYSSERYATLDGAGDAAAAAASVMVAALLGGGDVGDQRDGAGDRARPTTRAGVDVSAAALGGGPQRTADGARPVLPEGVTCRRPGRVDGGALDPRRGAATFTRREGMS